MRITSIALPIGEETAKDSEGFETQDVLFLTGIRAQVEGITRREQETASQLGYKADIEFVIDACNYNGQSFLKDESNGIIYDIQRTYTKNSSSKIYLTCSARDAGNGVKGGDYYYGL